MANTKVRCKGCDLYVRRDLAFKLGSAGWCCSELCRVSIRERSRERRKVSRILRGQSDDLSSDHKARIRARDGNRCRWCGKTSGLQVHHIKYRSQGGPNDDWNLITLCGTCHDRAHSDKKMYQPILLAAQWLHYVEDRKAIGIVTTARWLGLDMKKPRR